MPLNCLDILSARYNILKLFVYLRYEAKDYNIWQIFFGVYGRPHSQGT